MLKDTLKACRVACDLSQQQVADILNIHRSTYSYYELGKTEPSLDNIRKIAAIYGVSLNELLEVDPDVPVIVGDDGAGLTQEDEDRLNEWVGTKLGDLTRDEKLLILRFRVLSDAQRKEMLLAMGLDCSADDEL